MSEFDTNLDAGTASTMQETDKKCPSCGGVMDFDPATGGLSCPYCGHVQEIERPSEKEEAAAELDFSEAENLGNHDWGAKKKTVLCRACGAETVYDALEIASECPFCGSNQVMEAADRETAAPGGVVPFQVTDEKAASLFQGWIRKKWFCPRLAKESAKARHFKGVYLPYWTFDARTDSQYRADYGKERRVKKNNEVKVVMDWNPTKGSYQQSFDDELVCATTNHNQSMLMGIEPYDTSANKSYRPEYVAGFAAERYAVGLEEGWEMARQSMHYKISDGIEQTIRQRKNADGIRNLSFETVYSAVTYKYLLLPVWISSYKYKDKIYQFMVNGQTGKVSGKTPVSIPKVLITAAAVMAAAALIIWMSSY